MENWEKSIKQELGKVTRVQPGAGLFQKIEQRLDETGGNVVNMNAYKAVAAAVIVLLLNAAVLLGTSRQSEQGGSQQATYSVQSNYNIYSNE